MDRDRLVEVNNYSIANDATSMDMSNMFTGVGQLTADIDETANTRYMLAREIRLTDLVGVEHLGIVQQVRGRNKQASIVAEDVLRRFNVDVYVNTAYFFDTEVPALVGVLDNYCLRVGVDLDFRYVPAEHFAKFSYVPGGKVNIWQELKELAAVHRFDMWVEGETLVVDNIGTRTVQGLEVLDEGWSADISNIANWVEVTWFKDVVADQGFTWQDDMEYYPRGKNEDAQVLQVDAGESTEIELEVDAWVHVWNQPVCVDWVDNRVYDNSQGVYSVVGNDNLPITAAQWTSQGGRLTVEPTDDPSVVKIMLVGADIPELAPFRIAMSSGNHYNSLHLTGWAYIWEKVTTRVYTGAGSELTSQEMGAQMESRHVQNLSQAYDVAYRVARAYAGPNLSLDVETLDGISPGTVISTPEANFRVEQLTTNPLNAQAVTGEFSTFEDFNQVWEHGSSEVTHEIDPVSGYAVKKINGQVVATNMARDRKPTDPTAWDWGISGPLTFKDGELGSSGKVVSTPMPAYMPSPIVIGSEPVMENYGGGMRTWYIQFRVRTTEKLAEWTGQPSYALLRGWGEEYQFEITTVPLSKFTFDELHEGVTVKFAYRYRDAPILGVSVQGGLVTTQPGELQISDIMVSLEEQNMEWFDEDTPDYTIDGATFADFNNGFDGMLFQDFATSPLRRNNG